jgi:transcriptional regulator with XRE-family HTH domain
MNYAKGLTFARTKAGVSKRQLAKMVGVDASYITHIEAGRKKPSLDIMEKVAEVLKLPMPLLVLLSADSNDLLGASPEQAAILGVRLMDLLKV